jgi:hypothetical protein
MTGEFRSSRFLDFNSGEVFLPPMELLHRKKRPWDPEDKIDIFECRVEVWQLGVAAQILEQMECPKRKAIWSHAAYGLIAITFSYFEMIGKILNPDSKKWKTGRDFKVGFCDVYPSFKSATDEPAAEVSQFQDRIRNGMYHLAYTKKRLLIHHCNEISMEDFDTKLPSELPKKLSLSGTEPVYLMDPHRVTRTIIEHFATFISRLRKSGSNNTILRTKFMEFFDDFHDPD